MTPDSRPLITVVLPAFNEQDNVQLMHDRLVAVLEKLPGYRFEMLWIDNHSTDRTPELLRALARSDPRVKVIINTRNFGPVRSGCHALLEARGDLVVAMASDLQDPPEKIPELLTHYERGYKIVLAQKAKSEESFLFFALRRLYYKTVGSLSEVKLVQNVTGFGIYAQEVIEQLRAINDPYPYVRGLICDLGYELALVPFDQPTRKRGISKNNFYSLYDIAMLGITSHSKVPLRLAAFAGFLLSGLSLLMGLAYLVTKLVFWDSFTLGLAPVVVGVFFLGSVQLFFLGVLGEYVGAIHTQVLRRPLVVEQERLNFDSPRS